MNMHANHFLDEKSTFPDQDPLAEWVREQGAEPIVTDGEIVNEPDDVEERSMKIDDQVFDIHFQYQNISYHARVVCKNGPELIFLVSALTPAITCFPDPFVITRSAENKFEFPMNKHHYPTALGCTIIEAIKLVYNPSIEHPPVS